MWIRSQDNKKLINVNEMWIKSGNEEFSIMCNTQSISTSGGWYIGTYKNEDRCIEILNHVQQEILDYKPENEYPNVVFQMPEE